MPGFCRHHIQEIGLEIVVWNCMNQGLSNRNNSLSYFKCTHPNVRKAAVPPLFRKERGKPELVEGGGESV